MYMDSLLTIPANLLFNMTNVRPEPCTTQTNHQGAAVFC